MKPIKFHKECGEATGEGCEPLPYLATHEEDIEIDSFTTCWKMNFIERLRALFTGRIYCVIRGRTIRPMYLETNMDYGKDAR